jgi:hypothetical protein
MATLSVYWIITIGLGCLFVLSCILFATWWFWKKSKVTITNTNTNTNINTNINTNTIPIPIPIEHEYSLNPVAHDDSLTPNWNDTIYN